MMKGKLSLSEMDEIAAGRLSGADLGRIGGSVP